MVPASERTRHCAACDKSVIDVSKLTYGEAEALVAKRDRGAAVCVHLHVRTHDGAILLADGHAFPGACTPSFSERAKVIVTTASAVALAACATTPDPKVPELVPVVLAPAPAVPPPSLPAPPPPIEEPPPAIATVEALPEPLQPVPPAQRAKSATAKPSSPQAPQKGHKPPTYDIVDGGI